MILTNYGKFEFSNKRIKPACKENKEEKPKPNYITRADYEEVMKNIAVTNNDLEPEERGFKKP